MKKVELTNEQLQTIGLCLDIVQSMYFTTEQTHEVKNIPIEQISKLQEIIHSHLDMAEHLVAYRQTINDAFEIVRQNRHSFPILNEFSERSPGVILRTTVTKQVGFLDEDGNLIGDEVTVVMGPEIVSGPARWFVNTFNVDETSSVDK